MADDLAYLELGIVPGYGVVSTISVNRIDQ
ncbi:hypothetical protein HY30_10425 [Hyphomonas chukchiensis]|uniref:Uncharacterized protein n=1 Tax=Hyphomonas chukchiensis TaxID=1280947 RepID=A0A062U0P7_9PROT|nr:hypothetical protein HY30_10425 [Hyphomonas chukchiensis]